MSEVQGRALADVFQGLEPVGAGDLSRHSLRRRRMTAPMGRGYKISNHWKLSESDLLQCFSDQLARDDSVPDWQLRQAMKAVELYLNVFLPEQNRIAGVPPALDSEAGARAVLRPRRPAVQNDSEQALRQMKELLGHKNVDTPMIYTHVVRAMSARPQSPLDML